MQAAIDADPKNPLAKFEKAAVLMSQEQYHPALVELEALKVCLNTSTWPGVHTDQPCILHRIAQALRQTGFLNPKEA